MAKTNAQRQSEYRQRHLKDENGHRDRLMLMAVRNRGNLAQKSAGQHGCKRGTAALTAMLQRTRPSAASRGCCAGLAPALDPAPG